MTTTRQAYRLGERLGTARLLGFYYAHIGFYLGQLHIYHAAYLQLALAALGVLAEATGVLPGAAEPAIGLASNLYGWISLLFFSFNLLPLALALLREEGWRAALITPLKQLGQLSFFYFAIQSRFIGHCFARELSEGGGGYVATGRGLGIFHIEFKQLFTMMAVPCFYPAAELVFFLAVIHSVPSRANLSAFGALFAWLTPIALLIGPIWFNPNAFQLTSLRLGQRIYGQVEEGCIWRDLRAWTEWLSQAVEPRPQHGAPSPPPSPPSPSESGRSARPTLPTPAESESLESLALDEDGGSPDESQQEPKAPQADRLEVQALESELSPPPPPLPTEDQHEQLQPRMPTPPRKPSAPKAKFDANASWAEFHQLKQEVKGGVELHTLLLPSKELLMTVPLLLITNQATRPLGWTPAHLLVLALPVLPVGGIGLLMLLAQSRAAMEALAGTGCAAYVLGCGCANHPQALWLLLCAGWLVVEAIWCHSSFPQMSRAVWVSVLATRYFSWRAVFNAALYFSQLAGARLFRLTTLEAVAAREEAEWRLTRPSEPPPSRPPPIAQPAQVWWAAMRVVAYPLGQAAASHALMLDILLGSALQLVIGLLAMLTLGRIQWLQNRLLLGVPESTLERITSSEVKKSRWGLDKIDMRVDMQSSREELTPRGTPRGGGSGLGMKTNRQLFTPRNVDSTLGNFGVELPVDFGDNTRPSLPKSARRSTMETNAVVSVVSSRARAQGAGSACDGLGRASQGSRVGALVRGLSKAGRREGDEAREELMGELTAEGAEAGLAPTSAHVHAHAEREEHDVEMPRGVSSM